MPRALSKTVLGAAPDTTGTARQLGCARPDFALGARLGLLDLGVVDYEWRFVLQAP